MAFELAGRGAYDANPAPIVRAPVRPAPHKAPVRAQQTNPFEPGNVAAALATNPFLAAVIAAASMQGIGQDTTPQQNAAYGPETIRRNIAGLNKTGSSWADWAMTPITAPIGAAADLARNWNQPYGAVTGTPGGQPAGNPNAVTMEELAKIFGGGTGGGPGGVGGATGAGGGANPFGFNAAPYMQALQMVQQAGQLVSSPSSFSYKQAPAPIFQAPPGAPAPTDFSAFDEHMAAAAPVQPEGLDRKTMGTQGLLQGLAQAAGGIAPNAGLGSTLLQLGAGMLGGKMQGQKDFVAQSQRFAEQERAYQTALASGDMQKAQVHRAESEDAYNRTWQVANINFKTTMDQYQADQLQVSGGNAIVTERGANGMVTKRVIPLDKSAQAEAMLKGATIMTQLGGDINASNRVMMGALMKGQQGLAAGDPSLMLSLSVGNALDQGFFRSPQNEGGEPLVSDAAWKQLQKEATAHAMQANPAGSSASDQAIAYRAYMIQSLSQMALSNRSILTRMLQGGTAAARASTAQMSSKYGSSMVPKGGFAQPNPFGE